MAPTGVVAADAAFPFCGKAAPVTILVKAKILKTAKREEELNNPPSKAGGFCVQLKVGSG